MITNHNDEDVSCSLNIVRNIESENGRITKFFHIHPIPQKVINSTPLNMMDLGPSREDLDIAGKSPNVKFGVFNYLDNIIQYYNGHGVYEQEKIPN